MAILYVENGSDKGKTFSIEPGRALTVGRDERCQICIHDGLTSRQHFQLKEHKGQTYIRDLGSQNGTLLNDAAVEAPIQLEDGDKIQVGETLFTYLLADTVEEPATNEKVIGGFRLIKRLGRGGMGVVYRATQLSLHRDVALKILSPKLSADQTFVKLFFKEARAAGALNHPNIVQVYDVASEGDLNFISMELMEEGSVQDLVRRERTLDAETAVAIMIDAARGLEYAEGKKIVHRDIKPDNLMINADGHVKIADLGLAKSSHDVGQGDEGILGTPHFISPEQAQGKPVDTRADMYSLGATSYRIMTGETPFQGSTAKEIVLKQIQEEPRPVREVNPDVPDDVAEIIEKLMEKDPDDRYATASELIESLEQVQKLHKYGRPRGIATKLAVTVAVIAIAVLVYVVTRPDNTKDPGPITITDPTNDGATAEAREQLLESQAREQLLEIRLAEQGSDSPKSIADRYEKLAEEFSGTEAASEATAAADTIRTELDKAEQARLAAEKKAAERKARLAGAFQALEKAVRDSIASKSYVAGLVAALRQTDPELEAEEAYASRVKDLLDSHYNDADAFATGALGRAKSAEVAGDFATSIGTLDDAIATFAPGEPEESASDPDPVAKRIERYSALRTKLEGDRDRLTELKRDADLRGDRDLFFPPVSAAFGTLLPHGRFNEAISGMEALASKLGTEEYGTRLDDILESIRPAATLHDRLVSAINSGKLETFGVTLSGLQRGRNRGFPVAADESSIRFKIVIQNGTIDQQFEWSEFSPATYYQLLDQGIEITQEESVAALRGLIARGYLLPAATILRSVAPRKTSQEQGTSDDEGAGSKSGAESAGAGAPAAQQKPQGYPNADSPYAGVARELAREVEARRLRKAAEKAYSAQRWQAAVGSLDRFLGEFGDTREAIVHSDGSSHYYRKR